jgi:hypothetical protein
MADIAVAAGIKDLGLYPEDTAVAAIKRLNADVRIPTTITEAGARIGVTIDRKDIAPMSRDALNEVTTPTNPRGATLKDIEPYTTSAGNSAFAARASGAVTARSVCKAVLFCHWEERLYSRSIIHFFNCYSVQRQRDYMNTQTRPE